MSTTFEIPVKCLSTNSLWRTGNRNIYNSPRYHQYKKVITPYLPDLQLTGSIKMSIDFHFKNKPLDIDNGLKGLLDIMEGIVFINDNQIDELNCKKIIKSENKIVITVENI